MSPKILVIDDEEWLIQPVRDRLDYEKIEHDYAQTGFEGLDFFREQGDSYAAIVLDMKLPLGEFPEDFDPEVLNRYPIPGIHILEKIRELDDDVPILCFTVLEDHYVRQHTSKWKARHYKKGRDEEALFEDIHRHLRNKSQQK